MREMRKKTLSSIWDFISSIFGYVLKFCSMIVGNQYIFALFLFAIIVEILLSPFGIMQQKNSIRQARLKPKEMAIRKKYAGREDRETQQKVSQEIQEMYQKENVSPLAGCLPMLIQLPIIMALYQIVLNPLKYICGLSTTAIEQVMNVVKSFPEYAESLANATSSRTIEVMGAVKELINDYGTEIFSGVEGFSDKITGVDSLPNLSLFGGSVDLAATPSFTTISWILLVPFLTFAVYFASMKITRKLSFQPTAGANDAATGCSNKMMDFTMPLMSVFIAFQVPAAIGVYWIFKSIISTVKQFIIHKAMPMPTFTEEDYKAAEREIGVRGKGKEKYHTKTPLEEANTPAKKSERVGSVRSLHHIDDEDFDDTRERAERAKAAMEAAAAEKAADRRAKNDKISLGDQNISIKKDDSLPPEGKKKSKDEKREESKADLSNTSEETTQASENGSAETTETNENTDNHN